MMLKFLKLTSKFGRRWIWVCDEWKKKPLMVNFQTGSSKSDDDDIRSTNKLQMKKSKRTNQFACRIEQVMRLRWSWHPTSIKSHIFLYIFDFSTLRSLFDEEEKGKIKILTRYPNVFSVGNWLFLFFIVANMPWMYAACSGYSNSIVTSFDDERFMPYGYCKF